jgi:hypothetical protein
MPQRTVEAAEKAVAEATDQVVKEGDVICEDSLWDAAELALDGASTESIAKRIMDARKGKLYQPKGRWASR